MTLIFYLFAHFGCYCLVAKLRYGLSVNVHILDVYRFYALSIYVHTYTCAHIHMYAHMNTHTYTHICMCVCA